MRLQVLLASIVLTWVLMIGLTAIAPPASADPAVAPQTCRDFATVLGKEGRVEDSLHMHLLGCDDGPWRTTHYHAATGGEGCTVRARHYARTGYLFRPWTVAALVQRDMPWCTVYEDGSYEDNSTH